MSQSTRRASHGLEGLCRIEVVQTRGVSKICVVFLRGGFVVGVGDQIDLRCVVDKDPSGEAVTQAGETDGRLGSFHRESVEDEIERSLGAENNGTYLGLCRLCRGGGMTLTVEGGGRNGGID